MKLNLLAGGGRGGVAKARYGRGASLHKHTVELQHKGSGWWQGGGDGWITAQGRERRKGGREGGRSKLEVVR